MNINNTPSTNNIVTQVTTFIENAQWNKALITIREFVEAIVRNPFCNGIILCLPVLDKLCQEIGKSIPHEVKQHTDENIVVYIASQLYATGGHTAVIEDFIRAQPDKSHHILITNIYNSFSKKKIIQRFAKLPVTLHWSDKWSMYGKFNWLRNKWIKLNPANVFLFNHHQDSAIVACATPSMPGNIHYYHHIDFQLGLGKSLAHTIHIDMNPLAHADCAQHKYHQHIYLPLTCKDEGARMMAPASFMKKGTLHTASSGSLKKFTSPYLYSYADLVPEILKATGGKHTHIGPLDQRTLAIIHHSMRSNHIKNDRFIHIEFTNNLWRTMKENDIDLFITSFPIGGGRTAIEVMGSGIPVIGHVNEQSDFLSETALLNADAPTWKTPDELINFISATTPALLSNMAQRGRTHYESCYREEMLHHHFNHHFTTCSIPVLTNNLTRHDNHFEFLIKMSEYMAEGRNIEGRAIPRIFLSCINRLIVRFITNITQFKIKFISNKNVLTEDKCV